MLCIAASADPYGHVLVAGKPPTIPQLARIVGAQGSQVRLLVAELERNGVLSRSDRGAIVSRRMVRDWSEHAIKSQAGSRGGNPTLTRAPRPENSNGEDKQVDKLVLNVEAEAEEATSQKKSEPPPVAPRQRGADGRGAENGGGKKKPSINEACDLLREELDAQAANSRPGGAPVVPFIGRVIRG
jgi:hypothetical protein